MRMQWFSGSLSPPPREPGYEATNPVAMSFLRHLVPGRGGDGSDEEGEGEALLEHKGYSSSESESSSGEN